MRVSGIKFKKKGAFSLVPDCYSAFTSILYLCWGSRRIRPPSFFAKLDYKFTRIVFTQSGGLLFFNRDKTIQKLIHMISSACSRITALVVKTPEQALITPLPRYWHLIMYPDALLPIKDSENTADNSSTDSLSEEKSITGSFSFTGYMYSCTRYDFMSLFLDTAELQTSISWNLPTITFFPPAPEKGFSYRIGQFYDFNRHRRDSIKALLVSSGISQCFNFDSTDFGDLEQFAEKHHLLILSTHKNGDIVIDLSNITNQL